jgi:transcriptional regulator with XRE-family HTH domain
MEIKKRIGLQIREFRKAQGLTQDDLAGKIERSPEALSNIERGISLPGVDTLERLSEVLNVPLADFFAGRRKSTQSTARATLLAKLNATASTLSDKELKLAIAQIEAIAANK